MNAPFSDPPRRGSARGLRLWVLLALSILAFTGFAGARAAPAKPAALVKEINPTQRRLDYSIGGLTPAGSQAFFRGWDPENGYELWVTDGTAAATRLVYDLAPGTPDLSLGDMIGIGDRLFFRRWDPEYGTGLWVTDGNATGTTLLSGVNPEQLTNVNGILFFTSSAGLWKSNGTAAGTAQIKDFGDMPAPTNLTNVAGKLFFVASDPEHGRELWISDGSPSGTVLLEDINPGPASSALGNIRQVRADGWALFGASAGPDGVELWQTDGTPARTQQVQDLAPGAGSSNPVSFVGAGSRVFFIADDGHTGPELWSLNRAIFEDLLKFRRYLPMIRR
jgi:ELWxxDGT repeat protein